MNPPLPERGPWIATGALPAGWPQALAAFLVALTIAAIGFVASQATGFQLDIVFGALGCGAALALVALVNERWWVRITLLLHLTMLAGNVKIGLGLGEIVYMVCVMGGTILWFIKELSLRRRLIALTGFDVLLLTFFVVMTIVTVLAGILNGADPLQFIKEWGVVSEILFYFPLRATLRNDRDVKILFVILFIIMIGNCITVFTTYRERLADAVYAWQVRITRTNINEPISAAMLVMSALMFAYARRWRMKLVAIGGMGMGAISLVLSYSRGPMAAAVAGMVISWLLIPLRRSMRVVVAFVGSVVIGVAVFYAVLPQFVDLAVSGITARLASISSARQDLSLNSRVVESETVLEKYVPVSPVIGYGYGTYFDFLSIIGNASSHTIFIHNGIVWALYKFGIPCAVLLYITVLFPLVSAVVRLPDKRNTFLRPIVAGVIGVNIAGLIMNMTSNIFTTTAGIFNMMVGWALLDYVWRQPHAPSLSAAEESSITQDPGAVARDDAE